MISDVSFKSCAQCFNSAYRINGILVDWNHRLGDKSRAVIFWLTHLFGKSHYVILKLMIFSSWSDLNDNEKNWHSTRTSFKIQFYLSVWSLALKLFITKMLMNKDGLQCTFSALDASKWSHRAYTIRNFRRTHRSGIYVLSRQKVAFKQHFHCTCTLYIKLIFGESLELESVCENFTHFVAF